MDLAVSWGWSTFYFGEFLGFGVSLDGRVRGIVLLHFLFLTKRMKIRFYLGSKEKFSLFTLFLK